MTPEVPQNPKPSGAPRDPRTVLLLERRVSGKAYIGNYIAAVSLACALAWGFWVAHRQITFLMLVIPPIPIALTFAVSLLMQANTAYRLFPDRLEIETGLASRSIENIDLFRVRDVGLRQGLLGRLLDFGDVYVHSTDSSTPDIHVRNIEAPRAFYEEVRALVSASRAQHRTMIVEDADPRPEA